jgi:hypothetical protein
LKKLIHYDIFYLKNRYLLKRGVENGYIR